jgi:hypothetical protein
MNSVVEGPSYYRYYAVLAIAFNGMVHPGISKTRVYAFEDEKRGPGMHEAAE